MLELVRSLFFLQDERDFWKIRTKFNFACGVAATALVTLDLLEQRYSLFIKY